jgi:translation initiation factor IF-1
LVDVQLPEEQPKKARVRFRYGNQAAAQVRR